MLMFHGGGGVDSGFDSKNTIQTVVKKDLCFWFSCADDSFDEEVNKTTNTDDVMSLKG